MLLLYWKSQSLSHLIVHVVFSTKRPFLHSEENRIETYASKLHGQLFKLPVNPDVIGSEEFVSTAKREQAKPPNGAAPRTERSLALFFPESFITDRLHSL